MLRPRLAHDIVRLARGLKSKVGRSIRAVLNLVSPFNWSFTETLLLSALKRRITTRVRHDWYDAHEPPHFSYTNYNALAFSYFDQMPGPGILLRGFFSSEMVRPGTRVLDIGCGDGFFSKRFLAIEAAHIDAIDIDVDALSFARRYNSDPKVSFHHIDAVSEPFPSPPYDLVVWDGAIGHFEKSITDHMFRKIKNAMGRDGVFCGSEQLGTVTATDHRQHWDSLNEVRAMLTPHFKFVSVHAVDYFYDPQRISKRCEFYWRASDERSVLEAARFDLIESAVQW